MAYTYLLEDNSGNEIRRVEDERGLILRLIFASRSDNETSFRLIDYIDPHGVAMFSYLQMERVTRELEALRGTTEIPAMIDKIGEVLDLIKERKVHSFLRVIGD